MSPPLPESKRTSHVITAITLVVSVACLAWALHGVSWTELWEEIRELDWHWVAVGVIADLLVYVVQGWRWSLMLYPVTRVSPWASVGAIYVGLFADEVLPLRAGELIRCFVVGRAEQVSHFRDAAVRADRAHFRRRVAHWRIVSVAALYAPFPSERGPVPRHGDHHHRQHLPRHSATGLRRAAGRRDVLARADARRHSRCPLVLLGAR